MATSSLLPDPQEQPTIDAQQAADALGIHKVTLYRLVRQGEIKAIHAGRSVRFSTAAIRTMVGLDATNAGDAA